MQICHLATAFLAVLATPLQSALGTQMLRSWLHKHQESCLQEPQAASTIHVDGLRDMHLTCSKHSRCQLASWLADMPTRSKTLGNSLIPVMGRRRSSTASLQRLLLLAFKLAWLACNGPVLL